MEENSNVNVEETKTEAPKKKSGILKLFYWLVVICGCVFIFLGSYKIGYKLGNYFGDKNSSNSKTTKASANKESNSNVESNSNGSAEQTQIAEEEGKKSTVDTAKILEYYKEKISNVPAKTTYAVVDLNKDSIPELLVYVSNINGGINGYTLVYTYDETVGSKLNNYVVVSGILEDRFDNDTSLYVLNDGKILTQYKHMGYEIITNYEFKNSRLVATDKQEKQTNETYQGQTFTEPAVKFAATTDTSLIANYK